MTFNFDKLRNTMTPLLLAEAVTGLCVRIIAVNLEGEAAAWLAAVGLHEGVELVVLRRAALGGPLHVRTRGGGEFAVAREVAQRISVSIVDHANESDVTP
jgi:ferrous iron transport protein A